MIASASDGYISSEKYVLVDPATGESYDTPDEKAKAWEQGLARILDDVSVPGRQVIVVHPIPKFPGWDPRTCAAIRWLTDASSCGLTLDRYDVDMARSRAIRAEEAAIEDTAVLANDVYDDLCVPRRCSTLVDGVWLWRDGSHISVAASEMLESNFRNLLGAG